jgi:hypothetical protein
MSKIIKPKVKTWKRTSPQNAERIIASLARTHGESLIDFQDGNANGHVVRVGKCSIIAVSWFPELCAERRFIAEHGMNYAEAELRKAKRRTA